MRTVFNCLTKANHCTTGFQVLSHYDESRYLRHSLTQSEKKLKRIETWSLIRITTTNQNKGYIIINQWELKVKTGNLLEKKKNSCDCFFSFIILWTRRDRDDLSSKWLVLKFPWNPEVKKPRADTHPKYLRGCHVRFFRCVQYQKVTDRLLYISRNNW